MLLEITGADVGHPVRAARARRSSRTASVRPKRADEEIGFRAQIDLREGLRA